MYLDNVYEQLPTYDKASRPPRYIIFTPALFDAWYQWYEKLPDNRQQKGVYQEIEKMGTKRAPDWVRYEFSDLEEFYQHYKWITSEVE